jgi:hypothetical protein
LDAKLVAGEPIPMKIASCERRQTRISDEQMRIFLSALFQALLEYSPADVFNCDETSCVSIPNRLRPIANIGQDAATIA